MNNKIQSCYLSTCICIFKKKGGSNDYETSDCTILVAVMFLSLQDLESFMEHFILRLVHVDIKQEHKLVDNFLLCGL